MTRKTESSSPKPGSESLSYRQAGVDIDAGNRLVERIAPLAKRTHRAGVLGGLGGFGALFELPVDRYREPVLVSGTDGVGTKLKLAIALKHHASVGIDLVAMCVNDLIVQGAEPLFFLDYYATGHLEVEVATQVVEGIAAGCEQAGAALVGGETAEMPGMYSEHDYDLAGFCVGVVEKSAILDSRKVQPGDAIVGIASSGPHSNGYSLIREVVSRSGADLDQDFDGRSLGQALLEPTRIYVRPILALLEAVDVHGLCHITGGGLPENLPRVMPDGTQARIRADAWPRPAIFDWIQEHGRIDSFEMYRTFNCGVGMTVIVDPSEADRTLDLLHEQGEQAALIGTIEAAASGRGVSIT